MLEFSSVIDSRKLEDLDERPRRVCRTMIAHCSMADIELLVTSTYRDFEFQDKLWAIGRTTELERRPVTRARGGKSWHNYRCAWDVVPVVGGKLVWNPRDFIWKRVVEIGKTSGAEAGADWKTFPDLPHFQVRPIVEDTFITYAEALRRFQTSGTIWTA